MVRYKKFANTPEQFALRTIAVIVATVRSFARSPGAKFITGVGTNFPFLACVCEAHSSAHTRN